MKKNVRFIFIILIILVIGLLIIFIKKESLGLDLAPQQQYTISPQAGGTPPPINTQPIRFKCTNATSLISYNITSNAEKEVSFYDNNLAYGKAEQGRKSVWVLNTGRDKIPLTADDSQREVLIGTPQMVEYSDPQISKDYLVATESNYINTTLNLILVYKGIDGLFGTPDDQKWTLDTYAVVFATPYYEVNINKDIITWVLRDPNNFGANDFYYCRISLGNSLGGCRSGQKINVFQQSRWSIDRIISNGNNGFYFKTTFNNPIGVVYFKDSQTQQETLVQSSLNKTTDLGYIEENGTYYTFIERNITSKVLFLGTENQFSNKQRISSVDNGMSFSHRLVPKILTYPAAVWSNKLAVYVPGQGVFETIAFNSGEVNGIYEIFPYDYIIMIKIGTGSFQPDSVWFTECKL